MARTADGPHALAVGRTYTPGGKQAGLPGIDPQERLPSEQALTGEVLADRRRESMRALRDALGPCPEGFTREEWAVVCATLAPEAALSPGKADRTRKARECFLGLSAPAAVRAWLEVSQRTHVVEFIRDFRAIEALDVMAQREQVRAVMTDVMLLGVGILDLREFDMSGAAKCGAAAAAAAKVLIELDGLRPAKTDDAGVVTTGASAKALAEDPHEALARKVALVAADLQRRRGDVADES